MPIGVLFGTDGPRVADRLLLHWRFLETRDEYFPYAENPFPPQGFWRIYGVDLPDDVLKKIYFQNAESLDRRRARAGGKIRGRHRPQRQQRKKVTADESSSPPGSGQPRAPPTAGRNRPPVWPVLAVCGFLLLIVGIVFGQTIGHQFINLDDPGYVFENPHITAGLTLPGSGGADRRALRRMATVDGPVAHARLPALWP